MHFLIILAICAAELGDFIATDLPSFGLVKFAPEVISLVIAGWLLLEGIRTGFTLMPAKYWVVFGLAALIVICGAFSNEVGAGPIFAGMRSYLRAIPLFFVAAVFRFTDKQIRQQTLAVLALALLQVPIACYQRYVIYAQERYSGDDVRGTIMDSGILSIMLIGVALVLIGFFMRKELSKRAFFSLFFLTLLPTTINETKATVVLLPVGLLATIVAGAPPGQRVKIFSLGMLLLITFGAILVPVYDAMEVNNPWAHERHLMDFYTNPEQVEKYLNTKGAVGIGARKAVHRADAIRIPLEYLARDPVHLAFGLGFGNVSHSNLGQNFVGNYFDLFQYFAITSFAIFLLEIGTFGVTLVFVIYALLFFDAIAVARSAPGIRGSIAVGWIGVVAMMSAATFYTPLHIYPTLSYLFWYFGGLVASERAQLTLARESSRAHPSFGHRPART